MFTLLFGGNSYLMNSWRSSRCFLSVTNGTNVVQGSGQCLETIPSVLTSSNVDRKLKGIWTTVKSNAVLQEDNTLLAWGRFGVNTVLVPPTSMPNVETVYTTAHAFAALTTSGKIINFGDECFGGNQSADQTEDTCDNFIAIDSTLKVTSSSSTVITYIASTENAFAALSSTGKIYAWGDTQDGGDLPDSINDSSPFYVILISK